jgi:hypothetical protein
VAPASLEQSFTPWPVHVPESATPEEEPPDDPDEDEEPEDEPDDDPDEPDDDPDEPELDVEPAPLDDDDASAVSGVDVVEEELEHPPQTEQAPAKLRAAQTAPRPPAVLFLMSPPTSSYVCRRE